MIIMRLILMIMIIIIIIMIRKVITRVRRPARTSGVESRETRAPEGAADV